MHERVKEEIARRMQIGTRNRVEMRRNLYDWAKRAFPLAQDTDTRYFPTARNISSAMTKAQMAKRLADQEEVNIGQLVCLKLPSASNCPAGVHGVY